VSVLVEGWGAAASDQVDGFSPAVYGGMSARIPKTPLALSFLGLSFVFQLSRNICCYAIFARMFLILHLDVLQWSS
jgi:hypothetical protein